MPQLVNLKVSEVKTAALNDEYGEQLAIVNPTALGRKLVVLTLVVIADKELQPHDYYKVVDEALSKL